MNKYELKEKLLSTNCFYDNEWLDKYINLLEEKRCEESIKYVTQKHHKFPRHLSTALNEEIDDSEENLVILKFKDHLLAHTYLLYSAKEQEEITKCAHTVQFMLSKSVLGKCQERLYDEQFLEELETLDENVNFCISALETWRRENPEEFAKSQSRPGEENGMWEYEWSDEQRLKQSNNLIEFYKTHPNPAENPKVGAKISKTLMGHTVTEEARKKVSDFVSDSTSITNGKNNLRCDKNNVDYYAPLGYWQGVTKGLSKDIKKVTITNYKINHRVPEDEVEMWEQYGWIRGSIHKIRQRYKYRREPALLEDDA